MREKTNSPADFEEIIQGFLNKTLAKEAWTHEAHLTTGLWHVLNFGKEEALKKMRLGIRKYNESVGGINSETSGYHETITVFWIWILDEFSKKYTLENKVYKEKTLINAFLSSKYVNKELPLKFYSREKLFSVEARMNYILPDLQALEFAKI